MEILSEIKRIKNLMSINERFFLVETSLPSLAVSTALKNGWRTINTLGNSSVIERTILSSIDDATKASLRSAYKTITNVTDDTIVNSMKMTDIIDEIINTPSGQWTDDIISSLIKVYDGIPEMSTKLAQTLSKSQDIATSFKELQKLINDGSTTYDNILDELTTEIGANNARNLLNQVKLVPQIVKTATKVTLEMSQIFKNVLESPYVSAEIKELMKGKSGFINECLSAALNSNESITFEKFVSILNEAYTKLPDTNKINKNTWVDILKGAFLKEKEKPVSFGNLAKSKIYLFYYLPVVGMIAAYTYNETEQLYFDNCFNKKGFSDEEKTKGNEGKLDSERQLEYDTAINDCNSDAAITERGQDALDFLELSLPLVGSVIRMYVQDGFSSKQMKPTKRGSTNSVSTKTYENTETSFKQWMADHKPAPLTGTPTIEKNTDGSILGFTLGGKTYFLKSDNTGFE